MTLKDIAGPAVALVALGVGLWQYKSTSNRDFIRPVREAQLNLYQQASMAAAGIANSAKDSPEWQKSHYDFVRLYDGPMAIVEDFDHSPAGSTRVTVEKAMIAFRTCIEDKKCSDNPKQLRDLSLALAHTCRVSLGSSWGYDVEQLHGDYQKLIQEFYERRNRKGSIPASDR